MFGHIVGGGLAIAALLCGAVFGALAGPLFGAFILRVAAKRAESLNVTFWAAYSTVVLTFLIYFAILWLLLAISEGLIAGYEAFVWAMGIIVEVFTGPSSVDLSGVATLITLLILLVVGFLVQAGMISIRHELSFPKGLKLTGFMLFPWLLFAGVTGFLVLLILGLLLRLD